MSIAVPTRSATAPLLMRLFSRIDAAWWSVAGIVLAVIVGNAIWIAQDHQAPPWDQAHYLHIAWAIRHAFSTGGFGAAVTAMFTTDPSYPPLYILSIEPFEAIKNGVAMALVANTLMLAGVVICTAVISARLFGKASAPVAASLAGGNILLAGLSRTPLVDILLVLTAALAVMAAVNSRGFRSWGWSIATGVFVGLATLTKMTAPGILILPIVLSFFLGGPGNVRPRLARFTVGLVSALAVGLTWYGANLHAALDYLKSATTGQLAIGLTQDPLSEQSLFAYLSNTLNYSLGWILVFGFIVAGVVALASRFGTRFMSARGVLTVLVPLTWFAGAFIALAISSNQDIRYQGPGVTGIIVLTAGLLVRIRWRGVRWATTAVVLLATLVQFVSYLVPAKEPQAATIVTGTTYFPIVLSLNGAPGLYARRPGIPNYAVPIVAKLSDLQLLQRSIPLNVCLLDTQEVVNGNTLGYVAESEDVPLTFTDLSYVPKITDADLAKAISQCEVALYVGSDTQPNGAPTQNDRVQTLNKSSASARLTPENTAEFPIKSSFHVGEDITAILLQRTHP